MVTLSTLQALHPYTATLLSGTSYTELKSPKSGPQISA